MGSFVIAAVSTRFVFSAVSMEGPVYWAVRSSPMSLHELLKAKFWTWYVPVSLIASVLLGAGAAAVNAEVHIIAATMLMSWIICFGIVGVAVGLGAVYSRFDWEHPSELAASFGSLIYMVCATMLIIVNLLPVTVIIFLRTLKNYGYEFAPLHWYLCVTSCSMLMVYVARTAQNTALKLGAASLKERER